MSIESTSKNGGTTSISIARPAWRGRLCSDIGVQVPGALADRADQGLQVAVERAVLDDELDPRREVVLERPQRRAGSQVALRAAQGEALAGGDQQAGADLLGELENAQAVARGDGAHADLV